MNDGTRFSFRSFFLTLLLVVLFIFIMLWLFPTKSYLDNKLQSSTDIEYLTVLYDEIFANNVERMKDAAIGYFTNERMPKTVGESKRLTLQEMYDLHLVLKLKAKDGTACDVKKSYTEITKYTDEYRLKVNLSCGEDEDYIIVYLGCYNYCDGGICEKRVDVNPTSGPVSGKVNNVQTNITQYPSQSETKYYCEIVNGKYYDNNGNKVSKDKYNSVCSPKKTYCKVVNGKYYDNKGNKVSKSEYEKACGIVKKYTCKVVNGKYYDDKGKVVSKSEYEKACNKEEEKYVCEVVNGKYYDNNGKEVSKNIYEIACGIPAKEYMYEYILIVKGHEYWTEWSLWQKDVVVKTNTREVETKTEKVMTGNRIVKIQTGEKTEKIVTGTKTEKYQDGYTTELVKNSTRKKTGTRTITTTKQVKTGEVRTCSSEIKSGTTLPKDYELIGSTTNKTCSNCGEVTTYTYRECANEPVYEVREIKKEVPVYKTEVTYTEKKVPLYKTRTVNTYKTVTTPIIVEKTVPVYKTNTYYRYRDYVKVEGYTDIKWSYSKYDKVLIEKKYVLTGKVKEV